MNPSYRSVEVLNDLIAKFDASGKHMEAIGCLERILIIEKTAERLDEVSKYAKELTLKCNVLAMKFLRDNQLEVALELLKKAEIILNISPSMFDR